MNTYYIRKKINEKNRRAHAREILGTAYHSSEIKIAENLDDLEGSLFRILDAKLKPPFKEQAQDLAHTIIEECDEYGMDPVFVLAVIQTESKFNPLAKGRFGELGLMQIRPPTAKWISERYQMPWRGDDALVDPIYNVKIGVAYMNYLRKSFKLNPGNYISAYNMGPRNVRELASAKVQPRIYAIQVVKHYQELYDDIIFETETYQAKANVSK
jgi:soluble lytic murein transglycosylase